MGSYSTFSIGGREISSVKNGIDPIVMTLFRPAEKRVQVTPYRDLYPDEEPDEDSPAEVAVVQYCATAGVLRDRLNMMGFTLDFCRREFASGLESLIEGRRKGWPESSFSKKADETELPILERLTFEAWLSGFSLIMAQALEITFSPDEQRADLPFPVSWMLYSMHSFYGFPSGDSRVFLLAALEVTPPSAAAVQDLTELVESGLYDTEDDLIEYAEYLITANFLTTHRTIVLTEGPSDQRALSLALRVLKPHLADYYSFMDFAAFKVPGGAGFLVSLVKAFAGSGIINRIVALFDNDTAAESALRGFDRRALPANIRVLRCPNLPLAKHYPTLGPTAGTSTMDINGLACSLELFFGRDILEQEGGSLIPVQWRGYDIALKQYQGEIMYKGELNDRFIKKAEACLTDRSAISRYDWSDMNLLLEHMIYAFGNVDPPLQPPEVSYEG